MKMLLFKPACLAIVNIMFISFTSPNTYAQSRDSLLKVYNNETIHTFGKYFIKGTKRLSFNELKPNFTSGLTKDLYKKAKGDRILGGVLTVTAIGALVTSIAVKKNSNGLAGVLSGAAIGLNLASLRFRNRSSQVLDRAIWHRNKEILFGVTE